MKNNAKLGLIKTASQTASHQRKAPEEKKVNYKVNPPVKRIRDNQSFYVGEAYEIVAQLKKGALSGAIQKSLKFAYEKGELDEFLANE